LRLSWPGVFAFPTALVSAIPCGHLAVVLADTRAGHGEIKMLTEKKDNVVFCQEAASAVRDKWTKGLVSLGFCTVPSILIRAQGRLGLTTEQFTVIL